MKSLPPAFEQSIEGIVNYFVNDNPRESLRYQLFDIGTLLLRNDAQNERIKKWKQNVYRYLEREVDIFFPLISTPDGWADNIIQEGPERISDLMGTMFECIERYLIMMGQATLELDQHEFYTEELGGALGSTQREITKTLAYKVHERRPHYDWVCELMKDQKDNTEANQAFLVDYKIMQLEHVKWDSYLGNYALSRPQCNFSVQEEIQKLKSNPLYAKQEIDYLKGINQES